MIGIAIALYIIGLVAHLAGCGWVCHNQKQSSAIMWCVMPMVGIFWPLFALRMMCRGYDSYLEENDTDK